MMFIRVRQFILFVVMAFLLVAGGALGGYLLLSDLGEKFAAERIMFIGIIALIVFVLICIRVLLTSSQMKGKMDKLMDLARQSGILPLDRLKTFGAFGMKMRSMYEEIASLSERKSHRIILLNTLMDRVLELVQVPLLLVDSTGEIRKTSGGFLEKNRLSPNELLGSALLEKVSDLDFHTILVEAGKTKGPVEIEREGQKLTFYPVFSPQNDVAYLIVVFGEHEILNYQKELEKATVQAEPVAPKRGPLSRFFRMFLGDKKKKNK
ncbi:MAG: hypothetical protein EHM28_05500 [Spirochaetaceae bacterium]|nr:MAG: hypothetical protein EHM28_05500 [Spirochaetaceae bacterium]